MSKIPIYDYECKDCGVGLYYKPTDGRCADCLLKVYTSPDIVDEPTNKDSEKC